MKTAFTCWQERIAPVFDVARQARVIDDEGGDELVELPAGISQRVAALTGMGVTMVVCGAISRPVQALLQSAGIEVTGFIAGGVDEIIAAWRAGQLKRTMYAMPGCCGRRGGGGWHGGRGAGLCRQGWAGQTGRAHWNNLTDRIV